MVSQKNWSKKPSQTRQRTGKTFKNKNWNDDYADESISKHAKKPIISEHRRKFKQNIKRIIDDGNYDEIEEYFDGYE